MGLFQFNRVGHNSRIICLYVKARQYYLYTNFRCKAKNLYVFTTYHDLFIIISKEFLEKLKLSVLQSPEKEFQ